MEIICPARTERSVTYEREFVYRDQPGAGFGFPCNQYGEVFPGLSPAAQANYENCVNGKYDVIDKGVRKIVNTFRVPAVGRCSCGAEVVLSSFTNTCHKCGADYNFAGDRLAPREQWGEETGENWTECY